jgi:RNA polymerase sigma-70 factor (ECF subfamily)
MVPSRLADVIAAARRACPGVSVADDDADFGAFLTEHEVGGALLAGAPLSDEPAGELLLAFACGRGDPRALALFDERYLPAARAALARMNLGGDAAEDVLQLVREKLVLPAQGRVRLAEYAGQGKLAALVTVVTTRTAVSELRRQRPADPIDDDLLDDAAAGDPALALLRERYRVEFRAAFGAGVEALSARERNLLRLHLLGSVTLEKLAEMYGVHRATIVRWLASAREHVLERTRAGLQERLRVSPEELDSLMHALYSRIDVSMSRLFASET